MPIKFRIGSKVSKTVKTTRSFPLTIDHIRRMFDVADLRERIILSMATDLGLRIGDFISLKKKDLPSLDQEPPTSFEVMTDKEDVIAHGFLSKESIDLLKVYLPTLEKKKSNPYLFPSNGKSHISDEWMNRLLQRLADKAQIDLNRKKFTFHCFRKMFISASIDSGIGLTAGKKLSGKAIAQSDDTYLTTVNLRKKFIQLKRFLTIKEQPKIDTNQLEALKDAVTKLQEDLTRQKLITDTITQDNMKTKEQLDKLQYLVEFVNHFDDFEQLKKILNFFQLKVQLLGEEDQLPERLRPIKSEFSPYIGLKLKQIAKTMGISEKEALKELFAEDVEIMKKAEDEGLVHKVVHTHLNPELNEEAICNCCKCCCGLSQMWIKGINPLYTLSHYLAQVNEEDCVGCGTCANLCQVEAFEINEGIAVVNRERCFGCGVCAHHCPEEAIELERTKLRDVYIPPPRIKQN